MASVHTNFDSMYAGVTRIITVSVTDSANNAKDISSSTITGVMKTGNSDDSETLVIRS